MKESFGRKQNSPEKPKKLTRRGFLPLFGSALAAAILKDIPGEVLSQRGESGVSEYDARELSKLILDQEQTDAPYDADGLNQIIKEESPHRTFEGVSNSRFFITQMVTEADRYERELPKVLQFAKALTVRDPEGRSRMEYLQEMLEAEGVPPFALKEIRKQVVGLAFEESRYDAERESSESAQGILQIIPSTWESLSREGESVLSLVDQTRVAGELLSQSYMHLLNTVGDELLAIEAEFFDSDSEAFEQYFLAPVLINSYNAGMGTMAKLIAWFARSYGTQEKTVGVFGQDKILSGYDVFMAMAKMGDAEDAVKAYKDDASAYTFKVYGAAMCLLRHPDASNA